MTHKVLYVTALPLAGRRTGGTRSCWRLDIIVKEESANASYPHTCNNSRGFYVQTCAVIGYRSSACRVPVKVSLKVTTHQSEKKVSLKNQYNMLLLIQLIYFCF